MSRIGECESGRTWNGFRVEGGKAGQGVKFERTTAMAVASRFRAVPPMV